MHQKIINNLIFYKRNINRLNEELDYFITKNNKIKNICHYKIKLINYIMNINNIIYKYTIKYNKLVKQLIFIKNN
jgi:hypothetical protein